MNCTPERLDLRVRVQDRSRDQYGRFSYLQGHVRRGHSRTWCWSTMRAPTQIEKMGHIYSVLRQEERARCRSIGCGDIGAVSKLVTTKTGDTLSMSVRKVDYLGSQSNSPPPCYTQAHRSPRSRARRRRSSAGLTRLHDEDPSFDDRVQFRKRKQHIDFGCGRHPSGCVRAPSSRIKFGVEVELTRADGAVP